MGVAEDFFETLQKYNEAFLPMLVVTYVLGLLVLFAAFKKASYSSRLVSAVLGFLWLWSGLVFWIFFFSQVSIEVFGLTIAGYPYVSGVLFLIQAFLFVVFGVIKPSLSFSLSADMRSVIGMFMVIYAMIIYPLVGWATGLVFPKYPVFGIAPCPVTIFTFGLLLTTKKKIPLFLIVVPFIQSVMGIYPVLFLNIYADVGLILAGITATALVPKSKFT
ncbi:MAG: DUF6064 family protein [Candidatus Bathyarchaeia archaeon]